MHNLGQAIGAIIAGIFGLFFFIVIFGFPFIITFIKKRKQYGKSWDANSHKVQIDNKDLICSHCQNDRFFKREGLINTSWVVLFQFGFWNESATCLTCTKCKQIVWFAKRPDLKVK